MWPCALGMGEVVAPHDAADADLVAATELPATGVGRADLDVAVVVLAGPHAEVAAERGIELRAPAAEAALVRRVHHVEEIGRPEAAALCHRVLETGEALEHTGPDEER